MSKVVKQLNKERTRLTDELHRVTGQAPKRKHTMSASARRKIAAAQKKRWAKLRAGQKKAA
jgi:hypothetical protein